MLKSHIWLESTPTVAEYLQKLLSQREQVKNETDETSITVAVMG